MSKRRQSREAALMALYQLEMNGDAFKENVEYFFEFCEIEDDLRNFASLLYNGVRSNFAHINSLVESVSENWKISRMGKVDISILRMAIYELNYLDDVPVNVTINEAVEIGKKFGTEDTPAFVNGILDHLVKHKQIDVSKKKTRE